MSLCLCSFHWCYQDPAWWGGWAGRWEQPHSAHPWQGQGGQAVWAQLVLAQVSGSGCWGTAVPLPSPCLSQGTRAQLWVLMLFMLPAASYDSGEALPDEGINYALGTNKHSWLPCYTILQFPGRKALLQVLSGFHKAFYFKSTQLINLVDILHT